MARENPSLGQKKPPRRGVGTGGWSAVGQRLVNGRSTVGQRSVNGRSTVGQRLVSGYIPDCPQTTVGPKMHFGRKISWHPRSPLGLFGRHRLQNYRKRCFLRQPAQGNDRAQAVRKPCVNAPSMRLQCAFNAPSMRLQSRGGGLQRTGLLTCADAAVDLRLGQCTLKRSAHIASRCSQGATPALAARLRRCRLRSTVERVGGRPVRAQAPVAPQMHCMH